MQQAVAWLGTFLGGSGRDLSGYAACILVLATFSMKSMRRLRMAAIASNGAFILYASNAQLPPILVLHSILLPLNVLRLIQFERTRAALRQAHASLAAPALAASELSRRN